MGATIDTVARRITFANNYVHLVVLASPSMPAENFRTNVMVNPTIVVPPGAKVTIELINADSDIAHGLVVTADGASSSPTPMMSTPPAFSGAALWFLGESTSAGMHEGTLSSTAGKAGIYQYLCRCPATRRMAWSGPSWYNPAHEHLVGRAASTVSRAPCNAGQLVTTVRSVHRFLWRGPLQGGGVSRNRPYRRS